MNCRINRSIPHHRSPPRRETTPRDGSVDSFSRADERPVRRRIGWGAAALAGLSVLGMVSCGPDAEMVREEILPELAWPEGDFVDLGLAEASRYRTASSSDIRQAVDWALTRSLQETPERPGQDRHSLGRLVQTQDLSDQDKEKEIQVHYDGSDVVVLAFEGTGGYHPRKAHLAQAAAARLREEGLRVDGGNGSLTAAVSRALDGVENRDTGWSGLSRGPLESLLREPELASRTQWFSFASEEIEALSGMEAFMEARWPEILRDSVDIYTGETPGIENALRALHEIQKQADELGKKPAFVLVSHSSGGRSMVKFLEKAKSLTDGNGRPIVFRTALTIDPVREAHEAFFEGGRELLLRGTEHNLNRARTAFGARPRQVSHPLIRHRSQPESLYRPSNVGYLLNYYQTQDTEGLKIRPEVGIHGSPVMGAENREIVDVGTGGHGEIAIHPEIREAFIELVRQALPTD